jgi:hypothetical protein
MLTCVCLSAWNFTRGAENPPDVLDELKAWATAFTFSWDFFGDLKHYGLADDKAVRRVAKAAWKRLGARFMATWKPTMMLILRCRLIGVSGSRLWWWASATNPTSFRPGWPSLGAA